MTTKRAPTRRPPDHDDRPGGLDEEITLDYAATEILRLSRRTVNRAASPRAAVRLRTTAVGNGLRRPHRRTTRRWVAEWRAAMKRANGERVEQGEAAA